MPDLLTTGANAAPASRARWALAVHGGAGNIERANFTPEKEAVYRAALLSSLERGSKLLDAGGPALDAVEAAIRVLEDDALFNAGRGAVFTACGCIQLDAAIMDGATLRAGAVAGVTRTRNPITLARAVMERSPHVMLAGEGAGGFGARLGVEQVEPAWFFTERRWQELKRTLQKAGRPVPPRPAGVPPEPAGPVLPPLTPDDANCGTVGAVARDVQGGVAAGTSTGGTTAMLRGRIGDSPLIGAGTYASARSCAVSATGIGEYFIRLAAARDICALVEYKGMTLTAALDEVIQKRLTALGGSGGAIALTPDGQLAWSFNCPGMYRARQEADSGPVAAIFEDEPA